MANMMSLQSVTVNVEGFRRLLSFRATVGSSQDVTSFFSRLREITCFYKDFFFFGWCLSYSIKHKTWVWNKRLKERTNQPCSSRIPGFMEWALERIFSSRLKNFFSSQNQFLKLTNSCCFRTLDKDLQFGVRARVCLG